MGNAPWEGEKEKEEEGEKEKHGIVSCVWYPCSKIFASLKVTR